MASPQQDGNKSLLALLSQIQASIVSMQNDYTRLAASIDALDGKVNTLSGIKRVQEGIANVKSPREEVAPVPTPMTAVQSAPSPSIEPRSNVDMESPSKQHLNSDHAVPSSSPSKTAGTSRIILTTYPGQSGIDPFVMDWGNVDHKLRGPVVVSRNSRTVRRRNGRLCDSLEDLANRVNAVSSYWRSWRFIFDLSRTGCR